MRHVFVAGLLPLLFVSAGCSSDPSCVDCGPCGIAGPVANPGKDLDVRGAGTTPAGVAALDVRLEDGMCVTDAWKAFQISYDAGAVTVTTGGALVQLQTSTAMAEDDGYRWLDRDLSMSFAHAGTTLLLSFAEPALTTKVGCDAAGDAMTCAPM